MHNPKIRKARQIQGKNVILRNAEIGDAPFIFKIRTVPETKSLLSGAPNQLIDQENYLRKYQNDSDHAYFIVCDKNGVSKGTVRLHDPCNDQCAWGSWILHEVDNPAETLESALLLLHYAMELGFSRIVFHAKKENRVIFNFHRNILKVQVDHEDEACFYYAMSKEAIENLLEKHRRIFPASIEINYMDAVGF